MGALVFDLAPFLVSLVGGFEDSFFCFFFFLSSDDEEESESLLFELDSDEEQLDEEAELDEELDLFFFFEALLLDFLEDFSYFLDFYFFLSS